MTKNFPSKTFVVGLSLLLSGCNQSYLVLLEDHDGSTGQVIFKSNQGETVIDQAGYGANLKDPSHKAFKVDEQKIKSDFAGALASEPVLPETFLLYFETGGTQLTPESNALLPKIIETAKKHPAADISVIGHTDTVGEDRLNAKLARQRAEQVSQLFDPSQMDVKEITVTSHGEKNLLVKTGDETSEPKNRRVEVTIR
ncbi:OmpA family protein [Methylomonas sp. LL1]|uniref:OmpA family protein n=1 Tax=Methylomonas sp. LL1 TaxID=2785785 RepID=UPI0018C40AD8|nr:OmpA family protein [Methylomonas sp. LL1]QPK64323.1 OmpA family protein [Methylomonas sp. LL1]